MTQEQAKRLVLLNQAIEMLQANPIPGDEAYCRVLVETLKGIALMLEELYG